MFCASLACIKVQKLRRLLTVPADLQSSWNATCHAAHFVNARQCSCSRSLMSRGTCRSALHACVDLGRTCHSVRGRREAADTRRPRVEMPPKVRLRGSLDVTSDRPVAPTQRSLHNCRQNPRWIALSMSPKIPTPNTEEQRCDPSSGHQGLLRPAEVCRVTLNQNLITFTSRPVNHEILHVSSFRHRQGLCCPEPSAFSRVWCRRQ